ncbi:DivIVA domain-containing protein [bacterium]|nr:DivIVA domain-containing protein [bacterium]RQV95870.1 MAG: DivIVA domain-containing protein [bacterium]
MKLTPLEIKKQKFKTKVRGFDPAEVETFLEMVANEYETVLNEKNQFREEVVKLKTQLKDYQQVEKTLQDTLMNAQETVSQSKENSKREAKIILREAELKAERILDEAREKLDKMKNELSILRAQKESFAQRLKHLLESQIELIRVLELDDIQLKEGKGQAGEEGMSGKREAKKIERVAINSIKD